MSDPPSLAILEALKKKEGERDENDILLITHVLRANELMSKLHAVLHEVAQSVGMTTLREGATLFREGDVGTRFYIIIHGTMGVWCNSTGPKKYLAQLTAGASFGELALLRRSNKRSASLCAVTDCWLIYLSKSNFQKFCRHQQKELLDRKASFLLKSGLFPGCHLELLTKLAVVLEEVHFPNGVRLECKGECMYFLVEGQCHIQFPASLAKDLTVTCGNAVGDVEMFGAESAHATRVVAAAETVKTLRLTRANVPSLPPAVEALLRAHASGKQSYREDYCSRSEQALEKLKQFLPQKHLHISPRTIKPAGQQRKRDVIRFPKGIGKLPSTGQTPAEYSSWLKPLKIRAMPVLCRRKDGQKDAVKTTRAGVPSKPHIVRHKAPPTIPPKKFVPSPRSLRVYELMQMKKNST